MMQGSNKAHVECYFIVEVSDIQIYEEKMDVFQIRLDLFEKRFLDISFLVLKIKTPSLHKLNESYSWKSR